MLTIYFNAYCFQFIDIKPNGVKIDSEYFKNMILMKLSQLCVFKKAKNQ